jgi:hypothetical protein
MNSRLTELHPARGIRDSNALAGMSPPCWISIRPMSVQGLGCVKTFALASRVENLGAIAEAEN